MKKWCKKNGLFLLLSFLMVMFTGISVKAAAITPEQVKGTWDGEYDGTAWNSNNQLVIVKRHVTLIFSSCDSNGNFKGGLYLAAIPGELYQETGSWNISGKVNLSTGEIVINPGGWIKTISNFNRSYFGGTFNMSSKKLTGYRWPNYSYMTQKRTDYKLNVTKKSNSTTANKITYVSLSSTSSTLMAGKTLTLKYTVSPNTITPSSVKWTSSNTKVAKVSSAGKITAVSAGTATITCTASYNGSSASAKCTVKVTADPNAVYAFTITAKSSANGSLLSGANVDARSGKNNRTGPVVASAKTDSKGVATLKLKKGDYTIAITHKDFKTYYANHTVSNNKTAKANVSPANNYKVTGTVKDAATGKAVSGAQVDARSGKNNRTGPIVASTKTDNKGAYALNLPKGNYTLQITKKNFVGYYVNVALTANRTVSTPITQNIAANKYRIVLSWGAAPKDLDLHVTGPTNGTSRFHTYWSKRKYTLSGFVLSLLDVDCKKSYGPETNTLDLSKGKAGVYHIYVHDYSNRNSANTNALAKSGAKIDIYSGSKLLTSYSVPNTYGTVWQVCDIVNGTVKAINRVSYDKSLLTK